jgi:hypothetical protein
VLAELLKRFENGLNWVTALNGGPLDCVLWKLAQWRAAAAREPFIEECSTEPTRVRLD